MLSDMLTLHQICHWDLRKRRVRSAEVLLPAGHVSIFMWVEISSSVPPPRYSASKMHESEAGLSRGHFLWQIVSIV